MPSLGFVAIDELLELAANKKRAGSRKSIADLPHSQRTVAEAEATFRSARAFFYESLDSAWETVEREFDACEPLVRRYAPDNRYWVVPFAYGSEHYRERLMDRATVVE